MSEVLGLAQKNYVNRCVFNKMVGAIGFEPMTSTV